ncbi:hypothetical protein AWN76_007785 [Rhodothermaceae bacterium RA]|nr:hypothetical protein AWN76_007785 [Rhodothermaceae bacterium RA]
MPDIVLDELNTVDAAWLLELGVEPRTLSPEQVERTYALAEQYRRPSEADLTALVLALDEAALLVTGDGALREAAAELHVAVHGILWLLDRLVEEAIIPPPTAADGLQRMLDEGTRLPRAEVEARLRRWRV